MEATSSLEDFVSSTVAAHWNQYKAALLLSALGPQIRRQFPDRLERTTLRDLVRQLPTVQIIQHPEIPAKIGVVPASTPLPNSIADLFNKPENSSEVRPIYDDELWRAFVTKFPEKRYLIDLGDGNFSIEEGDSPPDTGKYYEIKQSDLSSPPLGATIADKASETHAKISNWLRINNFPERYFEKGKYKHITGQKDDNALARLCSSLDSLAQEDQMRISIPADILVKLSKKR